MSGVIMSVILLNTILFEYSKKYNNFNGGNSAKSKNHFLERLSFKYQSIFWHDALGQLIRDKQEKIENIAWRVDGKISYISRNNGSGKSELSFTYDAMGNRVEKTVNNDAGAWIETEYYVRDAQGNVMAIYKKNVTSGQMNYILTEQHIYGSSRLGVDRRGLDMIAASGTSSVTDNVSRSIKRGEKHYELSNHLGNVLATVSDKKIAVMNGANLSYYRADVVSYSDYYPFGAPMTERTAVVTPTDVRYGFNGKEVDSEINGNGNAYDFGSRIYDSRVARFLSTDKFSNKYSYQSSYLVSANSPISIIDIKGDSAYVVVWFSSDGHTGHAGIAVDNYKKVENKVIENGKEVIKTEWVPDGTVTYYDLWPERPVGDTEYQTDVKEDYNKNYHLKKSDLLVSDPSKSGEPGKVSQGGEGRSPDGVVAIGTNGVADDYKIKLKLKGIQDSEKDYNACFNNCSTFVQEGLKVIDPNFSANQWIDVKGAASLLYSDCSVVAPNNLFNEVSEMKDAKVLKGPNKVIAKPYLEYFK
jgi:RHS repeat-associated protein